MKNSFITDWVLRTVREQYPDDIALVVSHATLNIDPEVPRISFFVPITDRGWQFAQTFILEGRGTDIWGIDWARLERFAALEEYNITVLADSELLYARTEADAQRFRRLQQTLRDNLADPAICRRCALEAYAFAKNLYAELLFAEGSRIRLCAGYILDYTARAIAFSNGRYFHRSQLDQLAELETQANVPSRYPELYGQILRTGDDALRRTLCHELIVLVGQFLSREEKAAEKNFQDLADWYAELSYTWLRLRHYAGQQDAVKVHMWAILLQNELDEVCRDFGLEPMELLSEFDFENLKPLICRADALEEQMRGIITSRGGIIREYATQEDFLHAL